jgi:transcriptional adapter 3
VDDPIATALRHAQRDLRTIVATNKKRKERLAAIARDRLGHQEYLDLRDSIDKNISTVFSKLQKKDGPKLGKKKKKAMEAAGNGNGNGPGSMPQPCPAALGLGPDEENRLTVNEQLKQLVDTRRQWVDTVGGVFEEKQRENPGRIWGLPKESVYEGVDEEVRLMLFTPNSDSETRTNKGKERARGDEMDVG